MSAPCVQRKNAAIGKEDKRIIKWKEGIVVHKKDFCPGNYQPSGITKQVCVSSHGKCNK
jgi:hypothetical protein